MKKRILSLVALAAMCIMLITSCAPRHSLPPPPPPPGAPAPPAK